MAKATPVKANPWEIGNDVIFQSPMGERLPCKLDSEKSGERVYIKFSSGTRLQVAEWDIHPMTEEEKAALAATRE